MTGWGCSGRFSWRGDWRPGVGWWGGKIVGTGGRGVVVAGWGSAIAGWWARWAAEIGWAGWSAVGSAVGGAVRRWGKHAIADRFKALVPSGELRGCQYLLDLLAQLVVFGAELWGHLLADGMEGGEALLVDLADLFGLVIGEEQFLAQAIDELADGWVGWRLAGHGTRRTEDPGYAPARDGAADEDGGAEEEHAGVAATARGAGDGLVEIWMAGLVSHGISTFAALKREDTESVVEVVGRPK
jgi:hypothetical protein